MTRAPYLEPLLNWLKNSTTLNNHGIPGVPDLANKNIFPYAEWDDDMDSTTYGSALVILEPDDSDNLDFDANRGDCVNQMGHNLIVRTQVDNKRNTQQAMQESQVGIVTTLSGAYIQAIKLEELVRKAILEFNASFTSYPGWDALLIAGTKKAESRDGFLVLSQLYSTKYMF